MPGLRPAKGFQVFKLSFELNEQMVAGLLVLVVVGLLLFYGVIQVDQVENMVFGLVGVMVGRRTPPSGHQQGSPNGQLL